MFSYDSKTKNSSFIKMSDYLKKREINNNEFMLILYNENLKGVDPYNPKLTLNQKVDIIKECSINIWYYLRCIAKIPLQGDGQRNFKLDKSNCAQAYCVTKYINSWMSKSRQLCKTIDTLAIVNYVRIFHGHDYKESIRLCGKSRTDSKYMEEKLKTLTSLLPDYIQNFDINKFKDVYSDTPAVRNSMQADNLGRSFTQSFFHFQDAEFIPYILEIYRSMLPAYTAISTLCKKKGLYSSILFESVYSDDHPEIEEFINELDKWNDIMYDYTDEQLEEFIRNSKYRIIHIYNTYTDLGYGEEYLTQQRQILNNDYSAIRREVLLKRKSEIKTEE